MLLLEMRQLIEPGVHGVAAGVDGMDLANRAIAHPFVEKADGLERVALVAELADDAVLPGRAHQLTHLMDGMGQRFLAIDVLAPFDGGHRRHGVAMVGRRHHHGVDALFQLIEHLAKIAILLGLGEPVESFGGVLQVDVAQRDDVVARRNLVDVPGPLPAHAHAGDVDFFARRNLAAAGDDAARHDAQGRCRQGGGGEELTPGEIWLSVHVRVQVVTGPAYPDPIPEVKASHKAATFQPAGETAPNPATKTRLMPTSAKSKSH